MVLDWSALVLLALFGVCFYTLAKATYSFTPPFLHYSQLSDMQTSSPNLKERIYNLPKWLLYGSLALFSLAFLDPHWEKPPGADPFMPPQTPKEGIAIYLITDKSGSMKEPVLDYGPDGRPIRVPKIDILKKVSKEFVAGDPSTGLTGRPNDLVGLVSFARGADVLVPLTLDHKAILSELDKLKISNDEDSQGTAIGYAIYKTASIISATKHFAEELARNGKPPYKIQSAIMVLVTDGFQDVNPLDRGRRYRSMEVEEAAAFAKSQGVKLYVINVDPSLNTEQFQPHRNQMRRISESTGGKFYIVSEGQSLQNIYSEINQLEKSSLPDFSSRKQTLHAVRTLSLYPYFIEAGLILLALSILLQTLSLRRVP